VVSRRARSYPRRQDAHQKRTPEGKLIWVDDPGGEGWEIERELRVCPACAGP